VCTANRQLQGKFLWKTALPSPKSTIQALIFAQQRFRADIYHPHTAPGLLQRIKGNYATFLNYPDRELRYMDAGE